MVLSGDNLPQKALARKRLPQRITKDHLFFRLDAWLCIDLTCGEWRWGGTFQVGRP